MPSWIERLHNDLSPYRCLPFWSWNEALEKEELIRQIGLMQQAGMGGFFMHARSGLITEYMSEDWFAAVETAAVEAKRRGMQAWCYDENGWPSGFAGTKLLENPENYAHYLECKPVSRFDPAALACYRLEDGQLIRVQDGEAMYGVYDCVDTSVVDIMNPAIVRRFIDLTHEQYMQRVPACMDGLVQGFFTDEPQYCRWYTAYTPLLPEAYKATYGEELLDVLGALLIDCEQTPRTRFRYWRLVNRMYTQSFIRQIYEWCEEHGLRLTGHTIEEQKLSMQMWGCAGAMPFYEYEHIPGVDWLGRDISTEITPKQVSSVACQFGKKQVLTESFACTGWDVTPGELKRVLEWQYVHGVNQVSVHLFPYSIKGVRKYDHPAFFSERLPWFADLKGFFDYFARLGCMLAESEEPVQVGVIHPMHAAYLDYNREDDEQSIQALEDSFADLVERLGAAHIPHHYIDESLLETYGSVEGAELVINRCRYRYIVVPDMKGLDSSTVQLLQAFVQGGGRLYLAGACPTYIDGERVAGDFLQSNCTFADLIDQDFYVSDHSTEVRSTYRKSAEGDFLFTVNLSKTQTQALTYTVKAAGACRLNLETLFENAIEHTVKDGYVSFMLTLAPGESAVILLRESAQAVKPLPRDTVVLNDLCADIVSCDENSLLLDQAQLSFDGENYTEALPTEAIAEKLLKAQQTQRIFLKFTFTIQEMPPFLYLETEYDRSDTLLVNGRSVTQGGAGSLGASYRRTDILSLVHPGENTVVIEYLYYQDRRVYDVLFRSGEVRESLKNCLVYDTDIVPIHLRGAFGVYARESFKDYGEHLKVSGPFAIGHLPRTVKTAHLEQQGFPFFAGTMGLRLSLPKEIRSIQALRFDGRYAVVRVRTGEREHTLLFGNRLVLDEVPKGTVTLSLTSGNRNLFGPFHYKGNPEPHCVWGGFFTMENTWNEGESPQYSADYALVPFGIERIEVEH